MAKIFVDGESYEVQDGQNLLQACLSLGLDLPYFCWHPELGSVGACRQCAVKLYKDEEDSKGKLVMACQTPAEDGTRISIDDPEAKAFRASIIEFLMVNHPHDCPVCDEGGECHLQDMTVMTGHNYRHYRFQKRTHRNQYLGPFINHEMNRCIACYRCVRFYRDYAGGRDLDVFAAHNHVYFGRYEDGPLESEFSGNLVEICPTGVFTDKTFKSHYSRKWDLQTAPSICVHCGLGCNTIPGERDGQLRRIRNRYNHDVNGYFLCDRGRYGYDFVNSERRFRKPLLNDGENGFTEASDREAVMTRIASLLSAGERVIGIGSPRASVEANFALLRLVGSGHFYGGMSDLDTRLVQEVIRIEGESPAKIASIQEVKKADAVFILGEDVSNVAPMLALALRQSVRRRPVKIAEENLKIAEWEDSAVREAVQQQEGPMFIATPISTRLDDLATSTYHASPDDLARLGFAVAHAINPHAPAVKGLSKEETSFAKVIAEELKAAERPLVMCGTSCGCLSVLQAGANIAWALSEENHLARLCLTIPECNSIGVGLLGGGGLGAAFKQLKDGQVDVLLILENDLYRREPVEWVDEALAAAREVIVIDYLANDTTARADYVLPAATFAESTGTLVNNEARAQRFYQVFVPEGEVQASWKWMRDLLIRSEVLRRDEWQTLDDLTSTLGAELPVFEPIEESLPRADFRMVGQKIPRQTPRATGRTAIHADVNVRESQPQPDPETPLAFSMEGFEGQPPPDLITRFWAPRWNSVQSLNKFQSEINGPLHGGDPGCRLFEGDGHEAPRYFHDVPERFEAREKEWLVVPIYHLFGTEELSVCAPGIIESAPQPYFSLNPQDASVLKLNEGDQVSLSHGVETIRLTLKLNPDLVRGLVGLPLGLSGSLAEGLRGEYVRISK
jgi:NADH-quinone oxidoreductase subunit G